jgi:hypothetical protein
MKLQKDLGEFIELLTSRRVKYLLVGGHAVAYHGFPGSPRLLRNKKASGRPKDLEDVRQLEDE